jgi:hypothetical protein
VTTGGVVILGLARKQLAARINPSVSGRLRPANHRAIAGSLTAGATV